ncbi:Cleavage and polyadenylation specificity factor subunit 4 [Aphelenchoides besseyi]|nr:Cleavage and polyadenylation specificity factor subunit 4 [Aphelenchoides besseyi]
MPSGQDVIDDLTMEYKISRCLYNITDVEMMLIEQRGCKEVPFSGMDKSGHSACVKFTQGQCSLGAHCPLRHLVGDKQVVCKHWLRGLCKKGDQCEFLHEYDMSKMPECYFFSKFMSCSNRECPFRHIDPESKIKDCPWYDRGFCRHGPFCKHRHRRRVVCPNYLCGFCPDGKECKFTHPSFNIPTFDPKASGNTRVSASIMCHNCHERGHKATNCPHLPSGAQIPQLNQNRARTFQSTEHEKRNMADVTCYKCGEKGHYANRCHKGALAFLSNKQNVCRKLITFSIQLSSSSVFIAVPVRLNICAFIWTEMSTGKRGPKTKAMRTAKEVRVESDPQPGPSTSNETSLSPYCVPLSTLNPYITCVLCNGYFIEAITVMDCLHTFCKSCLLKYFEDHNDCPKCKVLIHQSHPTHYVSFDRTMQEIVYKLVPGLQTEEQKRREEFVEERRRLGLPTGDESDDEEEPKAKRVKKLLKNQRNSTAPIGNGNSIRNGVCGTKVEKTKTQMNGTSAKEETPPEPNEENGQSKACCSIKDLKQAHHRKDMAEIINLIPADDTPPIFRSFIRLSVFATITTLKRTLACTLRSGNISHYNDYDIFCNDELMGRDFSMMFIRKTRWRDHSQDEPLRLVYKLHKEF